MQIKLHELILYWKRMYIFYSYLSRTGKKNRKKGKEREGRRKGGREERKEGMKEGGKGIWRNGGRQRGKKQLLTKLIWYCNMLSLTFTI